MDMTSEIIELFFTGNHSVASGQSWMKTPEFDQISSHCLFKRGTKQILSNERLVGMYVLYR